MSVMWKRLSLLPVVALVALLGFYVSKYANTPRQSGGMSQNETMQFSGTISTVVSQEEVIVA